ncbi:protein huluwa isoform X2 [Brachyhypopomus gauderio]|uniref:protein huluwa isoform X2 n=1 Tax=Brachyhypopomus gauderio TaxID=698409 RepID=UPI0040421243
MTVLIPCVVLLLLLNCILLGYKILHFTRRKRAHRSSENVLLHSLLSSRQRTTRFPDDPSFGPTRKTNYVSVSEPVLAPPITSSLTSSAEWRTAGQRGRLVRPDGATYAGSGSLRVPSVVMGASGSTGRADPPRNSRSWRRSAPVILQSSSETERANIVPPNSPAQLVSPNGDSIPVRMIRRSSTMELDLVSLDKVHVEVSSIPHESCLATSAGPGLDSDFGASAGVSLRILSADSDGFPGATWTSALEWDYYDPSYVTQNHLPKPRHHVPSITTKQYWV